MVMSSSRRILLAKEKFSGNTVCIPYGVDVKGLAAGDCLESGHYHQQQSGRVSDSCSGGSGGCSDHDFSGRDPDVG